MRTSAAGAWWICGHSAWMSRSSQRACAAGVDLVSFSGDKLLGGPQAGILAGRAEVVSRLRRNPMFRALRLDKMIYQALEGTLRAIVLEQWERVPALRMIRMSADEIRERAERLVAALPSLGARVEPGESVIGGGSTPEQSIPTWLIVIEREGRCCGRKETAGGRSAGDRAN